MTVDVDKLVAQGETILWRDWRDKPDHLADWLLISIPAYLIARLCIEGLAKWWGDDDTSMLFVVAIPTALFLACMAIGAIWSLFRGQVDNPTIVTDRRILQASRDGEVTGIMLSDVTSVRLVDAFYGLQVGIGRKSDAKRTLLSTGHMEEFAGAIALAIGHSAPGRVGRLRYLYSLSRFLGFAIAYEVTQLLPVVAGRQIESALDGWPIGWIGLFMLVFAAFFTLWFIWWIGTHLVAIAAFGLMPRYANAEQAATWLHMETQFLLIPTFGWRSRPYAWLGRWIYGHDLKIAGTGPT